MLDCELAQCYLSARLDGAITSEEEAALEAHLQDCPACRTLSEQLTALHQAMAELPLVPPPDGLKDSILARVAAEPRRKMRWRPLLASAALFALLFMGVYGAYSLGVPSLDGNGSTLAAGGALAEDTAPEAIEAPGTGRSYGGSSDTAEEKEESLYTAAAQPAVPPAGATESINGMEKASSGGVSTTAVEPYAVTPDRGDTLYCGVLTLAWDVAEPLLKDLPYTQEGDVRSYILPAADFQELIQSLQPDAAADLTRADSQAESGLVLVTGAPE